MYCWYNAHASSPPPPLLPLPPQLVLLLNGSFSTIFSLSQIETLLMKENMVFCPSLQHLLYSLLSLALS